VKDVGASLRKHYLSTYHPNANVNVSCISFMLNCCFFVSCTLLF